MTYSTSAYNIKSITIAPCGHVICSDGFMGCVYEFRAKLGVTDANILKAIPDSTVTIAVIGDTGFPEKDWRVIGGDFWIEPGNYRPA